MNHCGCCETGKREAAAARRAAAMKNPSTSWRRFEFEDYGSSKFWSIRQDFDPTVVWVRYGKIGTQGTLIKKEFNWSYEARKWYTEKVTEKLNKDYMLVS